MMNLPRSALALLVCVTTLLSPAAAQGGWQTGRATYYGLDGWSIHKGACGLGYQYKNIGTGWDVAAIADASPEFAGSCGRCYEVRCQPRSTVKDGYGNSFDRTGSCKAGSASVVVRTVDNCPCNYPSNAYSNKRWCCGDNSGTQGTHFDMSIWAFEKLADVKQGVAGIQFRRVPCDYRPSDPAPNGPTGMPASESPGALGYSGSPYAPSSLDQVYQEKLVQRFDRDGERQGAVRKAGEGDSQVLTLEQLLSQHGDLSSASSSASSSSAGSASSSSSDADSNGCSDTAPSGSSCQQQKDNKQCSQNWLLAGNYCRATCGRCKLSAASSSSTSSISSTGSGSSGCTDVQPPNEAACWQQKKWGKCGDDYLVKKGYCSQTCGRCQQGGTASSSSSSSSASAASSSSSSSRKQGVQAYAKASASARSG